MSVSINENALNGSGRQRHEAKAKAKAKAPNLLLEDEQRTSVSAQVERGNTFHLQSR
jgi:hypothetical protein